MSISRRAVLEGFGAAGLIRFQVTPAGPVVETPLRVAGNAVELAVTPIGARIIRLSVVPIEKGQARTIPHDGSLDRQDWGPPTVQLTGPRHSVSIEGGEWRMTISPEPMTYASSRRTAG